jgi:hypothetical protein
MTRCSIYPEIGKVYALRDYTKVDAHTDWPERTLVRVVAMAPADSTPAVIVRKLDGTKTLRVSTNGVRPLSPLEALAATTVDFPTGVVSPPGENADASAIIKRSEVEAVMQIGTTISPITREGNSPPQSGHASVSGPLLITPIEPAETPHTRKH